MNDTKGLPSPYPGDAERFVSGEQSWNDKGMASILCFIKYSFLKGKQHRETLLLMMNTKFSQVKFWHEKGLIDQFNSNHAIRPKSESEVNHCVLGKDFMLWAFEF